MGGWAVGGRMLRMTCRCVGGMQETTTQLCLTLEWAPLFPGPTFGVGAPARRWGPVWQQVPMRQLESASACVAICPLRLTSSPLLLATEGRPVAVPHSTGARCLPGRGGQLSILPLFSLIFLVALGALVLPGVWKVGRPLSAGLLVGGKRWAWAGCSLSLFVCPTVDSHPCLAACLPFLILLL